VPPKVLEVEAGAALRHDISAEMPLYWLADGIVDI
jgi:hypothetical protein